MPRIRTLKPELAQDLTLAACSRDARYTFVLLITQADDYGLVPAAPRQLLGLLYPHDETVTAKALSGWVDELARAGILRRRWTVDGAPVLELVNWERHQRIDNRGRSVLAETLREGDTPPAEVRGENPRTANNPRETTPIRGDSPLGPRTMDHGPRTTDHAEVAFGEAWELYPARPNNSRAKALKAWLARWRAGGDDELERMLAGTKAYAAYVGREHVPPRFVKLAATFYGPDRCYLDSYGATAAEPTMYLENGVDYNPEWVAYMQRNHGLQVPA